MSLKGVVACCYCVLFSWQNVHWWQSVVYITIVHEVRFPDHPTPPFDNVSPAQKKRERRQRKRKVTLDLGTAVFSLLPCVFIVIYYSHASFGECIVMI